MKKVVFILVFCTAVAGYAQVRVGNNLVKGVVDTTQTIQNITIKERIKVPSKALLFNLGYYFPSVNNKLVNSDFWNKKLGSQVEFNVDFRMQFKRDDIEDEEVIQTPTLFAFGVGLGFSYLHQSAKFDSYTETLNNYVDADGDNCNVILSYRNVEEAVSLTYLDIPFYIEVGKPSRVKTSAYFKLGFKASILVGKKFSHAGNYTSAGYYPQWDTLGFGKPFDDIAELGYYPDKPCYEAPEFAFNPFVLWGGISAGVNFPFSSLEKNKLAKLMLRLSGKLDYSLTPIAKPLSESGFRGSSFRINQSNMLSDGSRILSLGLSVSLIYCL